MKSHLPKLLAIISLVSAVAAVSAQQSRTSRPQADIKVTYRVTTMGRSSESTSMIKGARERTESKLGYVESVRIMQCDQRRTIQLNDRSRKYLITPMDSDDAPAPTPRATSTPRSSGPTRAGGDVTYVVTSIDTGERKEMFGFTARHVKTTMRAESSPDACNQQKMHMEQDGWYIDLNFGLNCEVGRPAMTNRPTPQGGGGCQDRMHFRHVGQGRTGYPLIETTTTFGENDQAQFSTTKEVVELSREPLDAALFDVPAGYTEALSQQEMYGQPSMADIATMSQPKQTGETGMGRTSTPPAEMPRGVKIGVVQLNNKANTSVSMDELREQLINQINGAGVEAIPLNASSLGEAQIEAKAKECDYILLTDVSTLKTASAAKRIGGILGGAVGAGTGGAGRAEAKFDFKVYATGSSTPTVSSSASAKEETQEASVGSVVSREAQTVVAAVKH